MTVLFYTFSKYFLSDPSITGDGKAVLHDSDRTVDGCGKIKDLGFKTSMHIKMYGQRFEIVSDPFDEGECIAVCATSENDPEVRALRLPIAILVGLADRFLKRPGLIGESPRRLGVLPNARFAAGAVTTRLIATTII